MSVRTLSATERHYGRRLGERRVDNAAIRCIHGLQGNLATFSLRPLRRATSEILDDHPTPLAIPFHIDHDPRPHMRLPRHHQTQQKLQGI
jgi:hypothetical protein